ncbi:MAG TPA: TlpA disulfide reductase family protein [Ferrovibrio sp.]|jgi:thiol-disulfide isomerase/thioredoxin|uniref:TlpA family protein disulfide reductase n=1 Tax=Ferrovibrio sp. TaxID=1917215 RepID=UPI002B4AC28E|nr:TlpA disulfide reductase family protein [Ferrovibrio sp.]HLT77620.1 TlpA disulfide reductase family protein [Ferrovibrio sp.]
MLKRLVVILLLGLPSLAQAAEFPLDGEMRKFTPWTERKPVALAEFLDEKDRPTTLEAFRGKVVLLNLWATWCVPCREEMPALDKLQAQRGGADFEVVAVAQDRGGREKVEKFLAEIGTERLKPYLDTSMRSARAWTSVGLPTTLLIDRQGREVGRLVGGADWASPEALRLIDTLIAQN